jgi:branched-subunit amino acid ABC-type transport system permease component
MLKCALAAAAALLVSACGTQMGDRMASGAAIGAGAGLLVGGIGALPGAAVGAAAGAFMDPDEVNLGEPVWNEEEEQYAENKKPG